MGTAKQTLTKKISHGQFEISNNFFLIYEFEIKLFFILNEVSYN